MALLTLLLLPATISCKEQAKKKPLNISEVTFDSIFGNTSSEPTNTYCLLGTGFFRTPRSGNSDSMISTWIKAHPNALIISVSSFGPTMANDKNSKMTYCWIIDKNDTLNNYLVKNGCFPGGTMLRPKTWSEMKKWEKEMCDRTDEKPDVKIYVSKEAYDLFLEQIKAAETYAKENKIGIWLKGIED